ncbi:MAG: DUF2262 domain-containing protein [Leptospiraceae bacterium]|nr:DUF2262 domain-containing protein [Leptospiraceae bacterium]
MIFDKLFRKEKKENNQIVIGVVSPRNDGGGVQSAGEEHWLFSFAIAPWRDSNGLIHETELTVKKDKITQVEMRNLMSKTKALSIVKLIVKSKGKSSSAELVEFLSIVHDDVELNQLANELQIPLIFTDSFFGKFTLDRRVDWWETKYKWKEKEISLNVSAETEEKEKVIEYAKQICLNQNYWTDKVELCAVKNLLDVKNSSWLEENELDLTENEFRKRLTLESIIVKDLGDIEFWFNDGDLFWGHSILVRGNLLTGEASYAEIYG